MVEGEKLSGFSSPQETISNGSEEKSVSGEHAAGNSTAGQPERNVEPWHVFVKNASNADIKTRFSQEAAEILARYSGELSGYCCLALLDQKGFIESFELDRIYDALGRLNPNRDMNVLLFLLSRGGNVEPAYQISKLCKSFAKEKFVVCVPRQAKSAATLIAIGADEIHMGPLGQLGPIDPQLGGLPALGVTQALESIAKLSEKYPGSSQMFAQYLRMALTVEQIG